MSAKPGTQTTQVTVDPNPKSGDTLQARAAVTGGTEPYQTLLNQALADMQAFIWDLDHTGNTPETALKHRTRVQNFIAQVTKVGL